MPPCYEVPVNRLPAPELPSWLARMVPFRRSRVQVGDYAMHVMEAGSGQPVLLLHGNPTWGFLWRKVAQRLAGEPLRLIMPDLLGLGFSDKPRSAEVHTLENHARQIAGVLDALGVERCIFVGQDWGGPIGGLAVFAHPDRMQGAVILNTVLGPPKPGFRPTAFHRFARVPVVSDLMFRVMCCPPRGMSLVQGDMGSIDCHAARAYRYPLRDPRTNVAPLALARMVPDSLEHPSCEPLRRCEALFQAFHGPAEIVWGDRDPILGRVRGRIERLLPKAHVTRTEAGHFLQEEVPDQIAAAIHRVAAQLRCEPLVHEP
jgi:cis-3-alkyl-4-acyloxetan-2-one decarboxylase